MAVRQFIATVLTVASLATATAIPREAASANDILDQALEALGGEEPIGQLKGVTYHAPSLMQSYEMSRADVGVAISGSQNISFKLDSDDLVQRIDRRFVPSDYWIWASPELTPFDFSLIVRGGSDGFACYAKGNNQIWLPSDLPSGYTDAALAEYLVLHGEMLSPNLVLEMKGRNSTSALMLDVNGIQFPAVHDSSRDITIIMDPKLKVPYIIRTTEDHPIYGASTNDLYLSDYKNASGIMFPHGVQTVYNSTSQHLNAVLEDFIIEEVTIDPKFPTSFFDGIPEDKSFSPKAAPSKVKGISHARLTEFSSNMLWSGGKNTTVKDLKVKTLDDLPYVHWIILDDDALGVKQMLIEFEEEVIVCDAPPQWAQVVIEWVAKNLKKPITHVWPTHHHRDHSGGANEYVAAGAKLIVPEMAVEYWSSIPGASFVTFNETHPYVHRDSKIQAWFLWEEQATHAVDWSYAVITEKCPTANSSIVALEADAWEAGVPAEQSDQALMRQWLDQVLADGLTRDAIVFPTHGQITPLEELINITAYPYPEFDVTSWKNGAALC